MKLVSNSLAYVICIVAHLVLCASIKAHRSEITHDTSTLKSIPETDKCTAIAIGPKAGVDGAMTTHTMDCSDCDFRINKVPAQDWPKDAVRKNFLFAGSYPNIVAPDRGSTWHPDNLEGNAEQLAVWRKGTQVVSTVPQVRHTYALIEGGYAIMNEHQVAMGESTCASKLWAAPIFAGGKAQIEIAEMSKIALERSRTAREAIQIMGDLATSLGFYAADWSGGDMSKGEGGEGLTVIDKTEAWVFHVTSDDTGSSAIWCAQRLPADHVAVIANQFVIREIIPDSDDFMYSNNIFEVGIRTGFWNPSDGPLDFLKSFGPKRAHPAWASRRIWRVFTMVNPSLNLPADTDFYQDDYPFSVPVAKLLSVEDVIRIQQDHYEGTQFDLTKGVAAGPYGDPNRFDIAVSPNFTLNDIIYDGSFERPISLFRTSYSIVAHARAKVPDQLAVVWFGQYAPSCTSYAPLYVSAQDIPHSYRRGSLFNFATESAYWNHLVVGNYAGRFYMYAMQMVKDVQKEISQTIKDAMVAFETSMMNELAANPYGTDHGTGDASSLVNQLTEFTNQNADLIINKWRDLFPKLVTTYHDGYIVRELDTPKLRLLKTSYPLWWLKVIGWFDGVKGISGPDVILFSAGPTDSLSTTGFSAWAVGFYVLVGSTIASIMTLLVVGYINRKQGRQIYEYVQIDL